MRNILLLATVLFLAGCAAPREVRRAQPAQPPVAAAPSQAPLWPAHAPGIFAQSAIMIDARTGEVLFQKNADEQRVPASTQKLLTALLVARRGHLDAPVTIMPADTRVEPTRLGLRPGERYTRRELLKSIMVKSSNDACTALARDHSGSEEAFVQNMNRAAWSLGARNSHFVNSHGLPAPQFSTARDIARIAFHAYRDPELRPMMQTRLFYFRHNNGRVTRLEATNKLLGRSAAYNGMKTGFTNAAGRCLVSSGRLNGREVILVQLGSRTKHIFDDAERMMAWSGGSGAYGSTAYGTF
jgi:D-alanyl-D-alanine carboxypeptidase (penicillin-binding protein 5/6)